MRNAKRKITVAMLTVLTMVFTMVPAMAFAAQSTTTVKVTFSASTGAGFDMMPRTLTVGDNLTETYYPAVTVEPKGKVTVSDAIVAAHIAMYGDKFTKDPTAYYNVTDGSYGSGYVTKQFGHDYAGIYYVNGVSQAKGVCLDTVSSSDRVETGVYTDSAYNDLYSAFDKSTYTAIVGQPINVAIKADNWGASVAPNSGTKIMTADLKSGKLTNTGKTTNTKGTASISFSKAGTYYISAVGTVSYTGYAGETTGHILSPWAKVVVTSVSAPTKATAKSVGITSVKVSWKKAAGAKGYQVYRATAKTGKYNKIKTTKAASYVNKSLKTGKTYYYKIRAYKTISGKNYYSTYTSAAKAAAKPATMALTLKAGKGKIKASWKKVSGADGYKLYRAKSANKNYKKIKTVSKTSKSYTSVNLEKGKTYYYKVRAYKKVSGKSVYGSFSAVRKAKVK